MNATPDINTQQVVELITATIRHYLAASEAIATAEADAVRILPNEIVGAVKATIEASSLSYRDLLIIQLGYGLAADAPLDLAMRHPGARGSQGVAGKVSAFLREHHIAAVQDIFQNIGKNQPNLARGNFEPSDKFLRWASKPTRTEKELMAAFNYACALRAGMARPISKMPALNVSSLTFGGVIGLLNAMYDLGSGGAYEQFSIAALIHGLIAQTGTAGYRVETKSLNASDRSSRVAGDIQVLTGNRVVEAYEVTANEWSTKIDGAEQLIREHDLSRLHIVATSKSESCGQMLELLRGLTADVSVLDVRGFTASIVATLTRRYRAVALERLYEFLDRYQSDFGKVNRYVKLLAEHGLVEQGEERHS